MEGHNRPDIDSRLTDRERPRRPALTPLSGKRALGANLVAAFSRRRGHHLGWGDREVLKALAENTRRVLRDVEAAAG